MATRFSPKFLRPAQARPARKAVLAGAAAVVLGLGVLGGYRLIAQVEGERGIPPLANSTDIQVTGIEVDETGKTAEEARLKAWKQAQVLAWKKLGGPAMPVEAIDAMVASIVIEKEQAGPNRYVGRLGVVFDKTRASQYVGYGQGGPMQRSAPLLLIPVLQSGGVQQVFEVRGPWQRAWAEFQAAMSPIDYVRPVGAGGESLALTAGQPGRRSRNWWRNVLDQFEAADVIVAYAKLERQWPGGPVKGTFTARYGPDNKYLDSFTMTAPDENALPQTLAAAVERMDRIYRDAYARGLLQPDRTIRAGSIELDNAFEELRRELMPGGDSAPPFPVQSPPTAQPSPGAATGTPAVPVEVSSVTVQFPSPDAQTFDAALSAVRGVSGVRSVATTSLAVGGTSVVRASVEGGAERLAAALRAQGWTVTGSGGTLRISR
jgi:hypothetical protein